LGKKGELEECTRSNQRIQEGILARYGRCGKTRMRGRDVQKERIARKIYSKKTIWIVRQEIQLGILGKIGEKLEMVERKAIRGKKNEND